MCPQVEDPRMRSIEQIAGLAITIYADYCRRGISPELAREKAIREVSECTDSIEIRKKGAWNGSMALK